MWMIFIVVYIKWFLMIGEYIRDEIDMEIMLVEDINIDGLEYRKCKCSKLRLFILLIVFLLDNMGSEKLFRSGKFKINGFFFNLKLINR